MTVFGWKPERAGIGRARLDYQEAIGITSRRQDPIDGRTGMKRERDSALSIGGRARGRHDPGRETIADLRETSKIRGYEGNGMARSSQGTLRRTEESRSQGHTRPGKDRKELGQQRPEDLELLPIVAPPERTKEESGLARPQRNSQPIDRPQMGCSFIGRRRLGRLHGNPIMNQSERESQSGKTADPTPASSNFPVE